MKSIADLLKSKKDQTVYTIGPNESVYSAIRIMAERSVGALLVMEDGKLAGIVTERDYARKIDLMGRSSRETPVHDIMTTAVMYVTPRQTNEECMALMTDNRLRHLPVMENGKLVGLISIGDLVKDVISEQRFIIEQLEHYITGA